MATIKTVPYYESGFENDPMWLKQSRAKTELKEHGSLKYILVWKILNTKATIEIYNFPLNISKIYFMKIEHELLTKNITGRLRFVYVILGTLTSTSVFGYIYSKYQLLPGDKIWSNIQ